MAYKEDPTGKTRDGSELLKKARKAFNTPERCNAEALWAELAEFILPNQNGNFFESKDRATKKDIRVFDGTAIRANRDLASGMHSTITNPAMKWSKLKFKQDDLNDSDEVSKWLQDATNGIHDMLNDSNFDSQIGQNYQGYIALATMILYHEELEVNGKFVGSNFEAWHLSQVAIAENAVGMVDTIYRKFSMTLKQAYEKFGKAIGDDMIEKLDKNPLEELDFFHCIYPRKESEVSLNELGLAPANKRPFASCYVMVKGSKLVKEDGFYEFPVYVSRWSKLPGEVYGFGPGHIARADIRTINKVKEESLKALSLVVRPPIVTTKQNVVSADLRPGKMTTVRNVEEFKEFVSKARFDVTALAVDELQKAVNEAFYIDKLMLPPRTETGEMTAYEIQQRLEQMQTILGPVLSRLNSEFLTPFIMRCLKILIRHKKIGPVPPEALPQLQPGQKPNKNIDLDFNVMFVNSLARSQQLAELRNVQTFLQEVGGLAQMNPAVLDKINTDEVVKYISKIRSIPDTMLASDKQVQATREDRAKQQQMQQMLQAGEQVGKIMKDSGASAAMNTKPNGSK